jgi:hypothetical protein
MIRYGRYDIDENSRRIGGFSDVYSVFEHAWWAMVAIAAVAALVAPGMTPGPRVVPARPQPALPEAA